ncbi:MAG: hypothetical protein HRT92_11725 [Piscirickettsiaceae bacterium]|nr:hypothetical protein [Piscirickettsiaceae bacterium]
MITEAIIKRLRDKVALVNQRVFDTISFAYNELAEADQSKEYPTLYVTNERDEVEDFIGGNYTAQRVTTSFDIVCELDIRDRHLRNAGLTYLRSLSDLRTQIYNALINVPFNAACPYDSKGNLVEAGEGLVGSSLGDELLNPGDANSNTDFVRYAGFEILKAENGRLLYIWTFEAPGWIDYMEETITYPTITQIHMKEEGNNLLDVKVPKNVNGYYVDDSSLIQYYVDDAQTNPLEVEDAI